VWDFIALAAIAFCVVAAVFIFKLLELLLRVRPSPEKIEADRMTYAERLRRPDWAFYEQHLQRPVPEALKRCYADRDLISRCGFEFELDGKTHYILEFQAIDAQGLIEAKEYYHLDIIPFAHGEAEAYYLRPGLNESNAVYSVFEESPYDSPEEEPEAEDVSRFLTRLQKSQGEKREH